MDSKARERPPPSSRRLVIALVLGALGLALVGALTWRHVRTRPARVLRFATGQPGGVFLPLGQSLARTFNRYAGRVDVRPLESPGGPGNLALLERGEADLALLPNDTEGGSAVRAIAPLYDEVLQVVVHAGGGITGPDTLRGRRLAIGPPGSGTDHVARELLAHFDLAPRDVTLLNVPHLDAAAAFERGEVDAVFVVAGLPTPAVDRLLRVPGAELLSLGEPGNVGSALEGLRLTAPFLSAAVVPERAYGDRPAHAVGTLGVRALLVARADVPDDVVFDLARTLFDHKSELSQQQRYLAHLSERFDPADVRFPLHTGAANYYRRNDPPFILAWADAISLFITVALLLWSAFVAVREARHRTKKNRVDRYYLELQKLGVDIGRAATLAELVAAREQLLRIRKRAFEELMAERLEANESFTIFQDYLRTELGEIESQIRERHGRSSLAPEAAERVVR